MGRIINRFFYLHEGLLGWYLKVCGDKCSPVPEGPFEEAEAQARLAQAVETMAHTYRVEPTLADYKGRKVICLKIELGTARKSRSPHQAFTIMGGRDGRLRRGGIGTGSASCGGYGSDDDDVPGVRVQPAVGV
ncbi:MAG: hypothetical protein BWY63_03164 [Chloroflexi bacterium ADurb.Bin360]|nr:MAG: hypothetical protein BWY63_03164 [Chloroflexi bacterium ADurb.Bin360]